MAIAVSDFVTSAQVLVILILDAEGLSNFVDHVLVGSRVVAAGYFIARRVGTAPVGINVATGQGWAR